MKICKRYVGLSCVDGTCPMANEEEYVERGIPTIKRCEECFYYQGCDDCALFDTEYCVEQLN